MISGWRWSPDARVLDDAVERRVHRAGQVADRAGRSSSPSGWRPRSGAAGTGRRADPGGRGLVVGAVARLVAQRPGDDRRVVPVALDHPRHAGDPLAEVARVVAQRALEGVRLDVGLVDDVQAELVGQVEEGRVVGVVRGAHGVEAEALHLRRGRRASTSTDDDPAGVLVEVVAVDAADEHAAAVDQQVEAADLDPAEADPDRRALDDRAVRVAERRPGGRRASARSADHGAMSGERELERDPPDRAAGRGAALRAPRPSASSATAAGPPTTMCRRIDRRRTASCRRPADRAVIGRRTGVEPARDRGLDGPAGLAARRRREPEVDRQVERAGREVVGQAGDGADVGDVDRPGRVQGDRAA